MGSGGRAREELDTLCFAAEHIQAIGNTTMCRLEGLRGIPPRHSSVVGALLSLCERGRRRVEELTR